MAMAVEEETTTAPEIVILINRVSFIDCISSLNPDIYLSLGNAMKNSGDDRCQKFSSQKSDRFAVEKCTITTRCGFTH